MQKTKNHHQSDKIQKGTLTALVSTGYKISWQTGGKERKSRVESAFITCKYTNFRLPLTNVMVRGVSLNNPTAARVWLYILDFGGQREKGNSAVIASLFNISTPSNTTVKRIIKQQGHEACLNLTALFPPSSSLGRSRNMQEKPHVKNLNYQTTLLKKSLITV